MFSDKANKIFQDVIKKYHEINTVDQPFETRTIKLQILLSICYTGNAG